MASRNRLGRREFIFTSAGALAAGLGSAYGRAPMGEIEAAAAKVGRLPHRALGRSGRKVSVLVGAGDWAHKAVEAGILCGVNYWHRTQMWEKDGGPRATPQAILKNREAFYCEALVDRARGTQETGQIDEEEHYQFVKQAVVRTGLRYFDDMKFHAGYHNVAELKNNRGFVRAFERLKKEGLVRHLCLTQHSFNGLATVQDGESAPEILQAILADGVYEHAQFFYTYGETEEEEPLNPVIGHSISSRFVRAARRKGFGTIAMKTMWGVPRMKEDAAFMKNFPAGTTPHHAVARWLTTKTDLDAAVVIIKNLDEFVDTYSAAGKAMRAADTRALEMMTAHANREVCRLCSECMGHCPNGVEIANILRYERYATDYHEEGRARTLYAQLTKPADACVACGTCLPHCPQGLNIPVKLAEAHRLLS